MYTAKLGRRIEMGKKEEGEKYENVTLLDCLIPLLGSLWNI